MSEIHTCAHAVRSYLYWRIFLAPASLTGNTLSFEKGIRTCLSSHESLARLAAGCGLKAQPSLGHSTKTDARDDTNGAENLV